MLYCRVDDFPYTKPEEAEKHSFESFKLFDAVMKKHGLPYYLGVIPNNTTSEQLTWFSERDQKNIKIAMHGVCHDERYENEFNDWMTADDIFRIILSARCPMVFYSGQEIDTYIPPHNVIGGCTLNALKRAGFNKVLCGPGTEDYVLEYGRKVFEFDMVYSKPPLEYGRTDELLKTKSAEYINAATKNRDVYLCLHWTWENNIGLEHLDEYLSSISEAIKEIK